MELSKELRSVLPISMLSYFFTSCWAFLVPLMQRELGFLYVHIGLIVGISTVASLGARLALGRLADRFGAKAILRLSSLALFASIITVLFSYEIILFTIASTLYLFSSAMIYWTSMLVINSNRKQISLWLSLNNLAGFLGFVAATIVSTLFGARAIFGALFLLPLLGLFVKDVKIKKHKSNDGNITKSLFVLSLAGFFMVFHVAMWSSFLPIYLQNTLPTLYSYMSTGLFLACDSLFFTFVFYISGKVNTKSKGAALVAATTLIFTSIVSAIPLLPLVPFLIAFIVIRNAVIAFRMVGVAEMVKDEGFGNFQTQFYATFANSASIIAPWLGGMLADSISLDFVFYLSAPFGLLAALLFLTKAPHPSKS